MTSAQARSATAEGGGDRGRERRCATRFTLRGNAWFEWEACDGRRCEGEGSTRNVSKSGTFIETQSTLPVAAPLRVVVTIGGEGSRHMQARLCGTGEVRHVCSGATENGAGFGAWVVFHTGSTAEPG